MITQVSGYDVGHAVRDPRRKAQSMQFRNNVTTVPAHVNLKPQVFNRTRTPKENAIWASFISLVGAVVFIVGWLLASGMKTRRI